MLLKVFQKAAVSAKSFHDDEGGESGVQMVMVLALAAICIFGIGQLTGIGSGGEEEKGKGILGFAKKKLGGVLGGIL